MAAPIEKQKNNSSKQLHSNGSTDSVDLKQGALESKMSSEEAESKTDHVPSNKTSDNTDDGNTSIEDQLGGLPEYDDEKPVIKQEPESYSLLNVKKLIEEAKGAYSHCDIHKMDRMEKNVLCLNCEQLICALCLLNSHQAHEIRSVSSLKEYFKVRNSMEERVSILQQEQNNLTVQFSERRDLHKNVEESSSKLVSEVERSFKVITDIINAKQEQVVTHIRQFRDEHMKDLSRDIDKIRDLENAASRMITRTISFFSRVDLQEALVLPSMLEEVVKQCKEESIESLKNKDKHLPEKKFSKLLPSLDAVANICKTIHAEATKVVWSKTTKNSENGDKKSGKTKVEKRKHHHSQSDHSDNLRASKKPNLSSDHRRPSSDQSEDKKLGDKSLFDSLSDIKMAKKVSQQTRSSADSTSPGPGSEIDETPPTFKLVELKSTNIQVGKCVLAKHSEDEVDRYVIGKIIDSSKMKETTQYTVNIFKGEPGKDTAFEMRKKQSPIHSSFVVCNFDFDHTKTMSSDLKTELLNAKEYHSNRKRTRKRKSASTKDKSASPVKQ